MYKVMILLLSPRDTMLLHSSQRILCMVTRNFGRELPSAVSEDGINRTPLKKKKREKPSVLLEDLHAPFFSLSLPSFVMLDKLGKMTNIFLSGEKKRKISNTSLGWTFDIKTSFQVLKPSGATLDISYSTRFDIYRFFCSGSRGHSHKSMIMK